MLVSFTSILSRKWLLLAAGALLTTASAHAGSAAPARSETDFAQPEKLTEKQRAAIHSVVRDSTEQIWFQENVGQFPKEARYGFKTTFGSMLIFENHLRIVANQRDAATGVVGVQAVDLAFPGGTGAWEIVTGGASAVTGSYQQKDGTTLTPRIFNELTIRNIYDGVDLRVYSADKGVLEFDWIVAKAQDYAQIRLAATGQDGMIFNADGSATLGLRFQDLTLNMPATYQVIDGEKHALHGAMVAAETPGTMRYAISGDLVADQPLIIDPNVVWSTYIDLNDLATDTTDSTPSAPFDSYIFAVNANANGTYASGWIGEIITNGSYANYMEVNAGFVQGTVVNQTYLYRLSNDGLNITAWTSTGVTSPTGGVTNQKLGAVPADLELFPDGRVILGFGNGLVQIYSANLGARGYSGTPVTMDTLNSVAVVNNNSFYVGGRVAAAIPIAQIPVANVGPDATFAGTLEGVIIRYSNAATTPTPDWATYVGGDAQEYFTAVSMTPDLSKVVFATSTTGGANFPALVNAVDSTISGTELLVGVLAESATKPAAFSVFSFLGGTGDEGTVATNTMAALVTATNTDFFVGGTTASTDLPGTVGGAQPANGGGVFDAFASRIPLNGSAGVGFQSTYMGGAGQDRIGGIAYDVRADRLLIFGTTTGTFPTVDTVPPSNYYASAFGGGTYDIFVATVNGALTLKDYATYIGGSVNDYLGQTGNLVGQGHVVYSQATGLTYLATTVHSADLPASAIGTPPGKDRVKSNGVNDTHFVIAFNINSFDYGDAPATYEGGSPAREALTATLRIGATIDAEATAASGVGATGDDLLTSDDEDGIAALPTLLTTQTSHSVAVSVFNNTGVARTLRGWIDFNLNGTFEAGESASVSVPASAVQQTVTLTWATLPGITAGQSYLRVRLSDTALVDNAGTANIDERSIGTGGSGELEDYALTIAPLTLAVSNVSTTEGVDPFAIFNVTLSQPSPSAVTVSLALANGTAVGADYGPGTEVSTNGGTTWTPAATATFAPGATSVLVRTPIVNDTLDENTENFTLTATTTVGSTTNLSATGTGTIIDDDAPPSFTIDDVTRNEKAGTMTFTVTLSTASGLPITVGYATASGTATSSADFSPTSGTLNFAPGVTTQTIVVPITDDTIYENSENFTVVLSAPTNATISDGTGLGTILDDGTGGGGADNDKPTLAVGNVSTTEGINPFAVFTVSLSNPSAFTTTVSLALANGTAVATDYGPGLEVSTNGGTTWTAAATATFAPGVTSLLVRTPIVDDAVAESTEAFTLTATTTVGTTANPSATGTGTIVDDDAAPAFTINDVTRNEKAGTATFTVTLSSASGLPITVGYATVGGTATSGADFAPTSGTLSFAPGVLTQTIVVPITDDTIFENSESFTVVLSAPTNATITDGSGLGTILDDGTGGGGVDDDRPTLAVGNVSTTEGINPFAVFTVSLSNASAFTTTVALTLADGTAIGADYGPGLEVSTNGGTTWTAAATATFAPGATSLLVRTPIVNDTLDENTEAFTLTATTTVGTTANPSATGTGTILDNDAPPAFTIDDVIRNEKAGTATFTVTLSTPSGLPITVDFATASGTATSGADFSPTSGTLNFAPGVTTQTIVVSITDDTIFENSESFTVVLSAPTNATITDGSGLGTILDDGTGGGGADNDKPVLAINNVSGTEGTDPFEVFTVSLSNPSAFATTVSLALANGTAGAADYGPGLEVSTNGGTTWTPAATATFAPGATSLLVRTPIVDDALAENTEAFTLTATTTAGTTANPSATGTGTILDNDAASFSINNVTVAEEAGTATFTVTLSTPSALTTTVSYATASGTATSGVDFTAKSGTLSFAPGVLTQTITVPIIDDAIYENSENFTVTLSAPTNATIANGTGVGTIVDDPMIDNRPPVANPDSATTPEDTAVNIPVLTNDTDPDSDPLTVTIATVPPAQGTVIINPDGTLTFTPAPNFNGLATVNYMITDGNGGSSSTIVTVTVTPVNDAPVAVNDSARTPQDRPIAIEILANDSDPEGNPLTVTTATVTGGRGSVVINPDGTIEFTPAPGFTGPATVVYTISDGQGGTATATVDILVDGLPIATDDFASTTPGTAVLIPVLGNDIDPEGLPLTLVSATILPSQGTLTISGGQLLYTPAAGVVGTVVGRYTITDQAGNIASANVTITIAQTPPPAPPVATSDSASTVQQTPVTIPVLQNDSDPAGGALTVITASVPAAQGTVVINPDGTLTFTAAPGFEGTATINYTIQNPVGDTATAPAVVQVTGGNRPPIASPDSATAASGVPKIVRLLRNDTDPDGDPLSVVSASVPIAQGTVTVNPDGTVTFTSAPGFTGTAVIDYTITDGNGGNSSSTVSILVSAAPVNAPPVAVNDTATTPVGQPIDVPVLDNDSDPDGDLLTVTSVTVPAGQGTATINPDGTIHFVPPPGLNDDVVLTYTISDGNGGTATALVTINVNDKPIAVADQASTLPAVPVTVAVLTNDSDPNGNPLTVTDATADPAEGTLVINPDGTIRFTPVAGFTGIAEVTYTITDGKGGYAEAIAYITVNSPPVPVDDTAFTPLGQPVTVAVLANDTDPDGDPLTVIGATVDPIQGTVVINPDNTLTFTPAPTFTGPAIITYVIRDPSGAQRSALVTITRGNIAPDSDDRTVYTYCATPLRINPRRTATDADGDPLTVTAVTQPRFGRVKILPDGNVLYRPRLNYTTTTTDTFTVTISDGKGGTTIETIRVRSFAQIAGTFQGLMVNTAPPIMPIVPVAPTTRGRLKITLNNSAAFSARLEIDGSVSAFTGKLVGALTYSRTLRIAGQSATVTVTYDDLADSWSATVTGPGLDVEQEAVYLVRRPMKKRAAAVYPVQQLVPRGSVVAPGTALVRVNKTGSVTIVGKLPSGAAFSSSAYLDVANSAPIFDWVPNGAQSIAGPVQIPAVVPGTPTAAFEWQGNFPGLPDILDLAPAP